MSQIIETVTFKEIPYFESLETLNHNEVTPCQTYSFPTLDAQLDISNLIAVKTTQSYSSFNISKDNIMIVDMKYIPNNDSIIIVKIENEYTVTTYSSDENITYLGTIIQLIKELD